jgi:CheY-like chemotaxis protein
MSRVLLADDSPHAQRLGERILSDEGFEVVTVSDGETALVRVEDTDPDVVIADAVMPRRNGYEVCQYLKMNPRLRHVRVLLTAGALEDFDEDQARQAGSDGFLRKPFEASVLVAAVRRLAEEARILRGDVQAVPPAAGPAGGRTPAAPFIAVLDAEKLRAAVTVALDASMGAMVEEITAQVLAALAPRPSAETEHRSESAPAPPPAPPPAPLPAQPPEAAKAPRYTGRAMHARAASSISILGLDSGPEEPEEGPPDRS